MRADIPARNVDIYSFYARFPLGNFHLYGGRLHSRDLRGDFRDLYDCNARDYGREEGIDIGKSQGISIGMSKGIDIVARNLLKETNDINYISKVTGLTEKEIEKLKQPS